MRLFVATFALCLALGCSHRSPYVSGDPVDLDAEVIAPSDIRARLVLVGDAGVPDPRLIDRITEWVSDPERSMVVYLGDNIYPDGLPAPGVDGHDEAIRRLDLQLRPMLETGCRGLFIPGNHDWGIDGDEGLARVRRQAAYVRRILGPEAWAPDPGCPGPTIVRAWGFRVLAIDTEWWLREGTFAANGLPCPSSRAGAEVALRTALEENEAADLTIVAGHHPLATRGPHGGFFEWRDHVFPLRNLHPALWIPLPVLGSAYPLVRGLMNNDQDLGGEANVAMRDAIVETLTASRPFMVASGHEHSVQFFAHKPWAPFTVVSGAGSPSKVTPVGHDDDTWFAHAAPGFVVLDRLTNGSLLARFVTLDAERADGAVAGWWLR